jgi:hypothetical protein
MYDLLQYSVLAYIYKLFIRKLNIVSFALKYYNKFMSLIYLSNYIKTE